MNGQRRNKYTPILTSAHKLVHDNDANYLAKLLDKTPNTLRNEVNPNMLGHKLGLVDAIKLTLATGNPILLQACNMMCGYVAVPMAMLNAIDDEDILNQWANWQCKVGETSITIKDALQDGKITPNELAQIQHVGLEKCGAFLALLQTLQSYSETKKGVAHVVA